MQKIEITHGSITAEIEYTVGQLEVLAPERFTLLFRHLLALHSRVPLASFQFKSPVAAEGYAYKFTAVDGRTWTQALWFDQPSDPEQTFSTGSHRWRESEFTIHRKVREQIVFLYGAIGLAKVEVSFT